MRTTVTPLGHVCWEMRCAMPLTSMSVRGMMAATRASKLGQRCRSALSIASMWLTVALPSLDGASLLPAWISATVGVQPKAALPLSAEWTLLRTLEEPAPHCARCRMAAPKQ